MGEPARHSEITAKRPSEGVIRAIVGPFAEFFRRQGATIVLAFILVHKIGDTLANLTFRLLFNDLGFSKDEIALYDVGVGFWALLIGVFVGGVLYARLGMKRSVIISLILMAVSNLSFAGLAAAGHSNLGMAGAIGFENFASGIGGVTVVAYFSALTDLRFPHHENELAQSTAAGDGFARYWVHNGLVTVDGQKMSKSLGNFTLAADVLRDHDPLVVRYALAAAHYRSSLDLSESSWDEAETALGRIRSFLDRGRRLAAPGYAEYKEGVPTEFWEAMNDDLAVPRALAAIHTSIRSGNALLDAGRHDEARQDVMDVMQMTSILGLDPHAPEWASNDTGGTAAALDALVQEMIAQRAQARGDKDWATADRIRDAIAAAGITLEDTPAGTHWSIDG